MSFPLGVHTSSIGVKKDNFTINMFNKSKIKCIFVTEFNSMNNEIILL